MSDADDRPIPARVPTVQEEQPGVRMWCACGRSEGQPFCDGSHAGTAYTPVRVEIAETRKVAWCDCKRSGNPPYCDGSHAQL
jgi:CDGSH-type Zn-finger protein